MSTVSRKAPAPPVLDYPPPGVFPGGPPPPAVGPVGHAPSPAVAPLAYPPPHPMPHAAGGTRNPADPLRHPHADPRVGPTALLAARVLDLLRANGLRLSGRLSGRLPAAPALSGSLRLPGARRYWWAYSLVLAGVLALGVRLGGALAGALADPLTTLQYGEVRTTHLSVLFGLPKVCYP